MNNFKLIGFFFLVASLSACRISQKSVTGQWVTYSDTLIFENTKRFILTSRQKQYEGIWYVKKRSVYMDFKDEAGKTAFGNCGGLNNNRISFTKYKLIRPRHCGLARHDFSVYRKTGHFSTH